MLKIWISGEIFMKVTKKNQSNSHLLTKKVQGKMFISLNTKNRKKRNIAKR